MRMVQRSKNIVPFSIQLQTFGDLKERKQCWLLAAGAGVNFGCFGHAAVFKRCVDGKGA